MGDGGEGGFERVMLRLRVSRGDGEGTREREVACERVCMDINPYKFENPWDAYELANAAREAIDLVQFGVDERAPGGRFGDEAETVSSSDSRTGWLDWNR